MVAEIMDIEYKRKLATIRQISDVKPIEGADRIVAYQVDGWWVVDSKDKYQVGDVVIYIEPDAFVPTTLAGFLSKGKEPREYMGIKGEKLRTIRLKGQLSQGLLLEFSAQLAIKLGAGSGAKFADFLGHDVTEILGIIKWEPPVNPQLAGQTKGNFPSTVIKTDAERCQNLKRQIVDWSDAGIEWEVTEKLEGTSVTFALLGDEFIVCSRNVNLKEDDTNLYWKIAREYDIEKKMRDAGLNDYAIQGEIWGNGVQGNIYQVQQQYLSIFTVQYKGQYLTPADRQELCKKLSLPHSPVLHNDWKIDGKSIDEILLMADGQSVCGTIGCLREGLVFKSKDGKHIWKAVSPNYLIRYS